MDEIIPFLKEYITANDKMLLSIESTINFVIKYKNILEKVFISLKKLINGNIFILIIYHYKQYTFV
jgi:hypothetical protein